MKEIPADDRVIEVHIGVKALLRRGKGEIAPVAVGVKAEGQGLKGGEVPAEEIGVFAQGGAVFLIAVFLGLDVGVIKSAGHNGQAVVTEQVPVIEVIEGGIGGLVVLPGLEEPGRSLQLLLGGEGALVEGEGIGLSGFLGAVQLGHAAGDLESVHSARPFS